MTAIYEEPKKPRQIGWLNGAQAAIHGSATMKSTLILAIGCGLFASVAFAQGQPAATGAPSAQDFVNKVAISDMFEIQSSQMALSKQADADTKPFAEKMTPRSSQDIQRIESAGRGQHGQIDLASLAGFRASENAR
jgi:hypothetical protein